ncbi:MAG: PepSY domain-containing protein, partial [Cardiobacteriaceae bacterium]|nr:PepSY domain-containing protein [Cardiobacteriaceae bacterium]
MLNKKHLLAVAVAIAAVGASHAQINASQAANAAKAHVAGRVADVDYYAKRGQYEVDVIAADGRRHEVRIDARSGRVIDSRLDRDDDDDDRRAAPGQPRRDHDDDRDDDRVDDRDDDRDDRDNDRDD